MSEPLTERQIKDLTMLGDPSQWPYDPMIPMKNYHRDEGNTGVSFEPGVLVVFSHTYMFYPGLDMFMPKEEVATHIATHEARGPMHAPQLEDLIREGWEID
jgi:hypothetical protein